MPFLPDATTPEPASTADADSSADFEASDLNRGGSGSSDGCLIELDDLQPAAPTSAETDDSLDPPPSYASIAKPPPSTSSPVRPEPIYPPLPPPSPSPPPSPMYSAPIGPVFGQNNVCSSDRCILEAPGTEPRDRFRRTHRRTPPITSEADAIAVCTEATRSIFNPGTNTLHILHRGDPVVPDLPSYVARVRDERAVAEDNFARYGQLLRCFPWTENRPIDRELLPYVELSVLRERRRQEIALRSRLGPLPPRFYLHEFNVEENGRTRISQIWIPVGEDPPTTFEELCELEGEFPEGALWESRFPEYLHFEDYLFNLPPLGESPCEDDLEERIYRCPDNFVIHTSPDPAPPLWMREAPPLPVTAGLFSAVKPPAGLLAAAARADGDGDQNSSDMVVEPPTDPVARSPENEVDEETDGDRSSTVPRRSRRPRPRRLDLARSLADLPARVEDEMSSVSDTASEDTEVASIMTRRSSSFAGSSSSGFRPLNRVQTMRDLINR